MITFIASLCCMVAHSWQAVGFITGARTSMGIRVVTPRINMALFVLLLNCSIALVGDIRSEGSFFWFVDA